MGTTRLAREGELDELLGLYRMLNPGDDLPDTEEAVDLYDEMLADESLDVVVVEHDDRLVATCVLSVTKNLSRGARPWAVIENVVTHEDYRGRGFGTQCVEAAVDRAEARDCYKVMLLTGSDERWKHEFYESCGFDPDEKTGFVRDLRAE
jgi:GNAT superfamily N-acetyltransferase